MRCACETCLCRPAAVGRPFPIIVERPEKSKPAAAAAVPVAPAPAVRAVLPGVAAGGRRRAGRRVRVLPAALLAGLLAQSDLVVGRVDVDDLDRDGVAEV